MIQLLIHMLDPDLSKLRGRQRAHHRGAQPDMKLSVGCDDVHAARPVERLAEAEPFAVAAAMVRLA